MQHAKKEIFFFKRFFTILGHFVKRIYEFYLEQKSKRVQSIVIVFILPQ